MISDDDLREIEDRAKDYDDRMLPACPHGREPVDRCDVCTGYDVMTLLAEVRRLKTELDVAIRSRGDK